MISTFSILCISINININLHVDLLIFMIFYSAIFFVQHSAINMLNDKQFNHHICIAFIMYLACKSIQSLFFGLLRWLFYFDLVLIFFCLINKIVYMSEKEKKDFFFVRKRKERLSFENWAPINVQSLSSALLLGINAKAELRHDISLQRSSSR